MMPMQNNPMIQLLNLMRSGGNASPLLTQMSRSNPKMGQAMQLMQGKHGESLKNTCLQAYKEMGVDVEQVANQFGLQIPK